MPASEPLFPQLCDLLFDARDRAGAMHLDHVPRTRPALPFTNASRRMRRLAEPYGGVQDKLGGEMLLAQRLGVPRAIGAVRLADDPASVLRQVACGARSARTSATRSSFSCGDPSNIPIMRADCAF